MNNDLNKFYYDILNISKKNIDVEPLINKAISDEKKAIDEKKADIAGFCKYVTNNIRYTLKHLGVNVVYYDIGELIKINYHHYFLIVCSKYNNELKYHLIDPTYVQFRKKDNNVLNSKFDNWPAEVLSITQNGKFIAERLIDDGFCRINDDLIKLYLGSFISESDISKIDFNLDKSIFENRLSK